MTPRAFPPSKPVVVEPRWKERFQTVARRATKETNERSRAKQGKKYKKKETRKKEKEKNGKIKGDAEEHSFVQAWRNSLFEAIVCITTSVYFLF